MTRDTRGDADYAAWLATFTPEARERLKELGLDRLPSEEPTPGGCMNGDAADLPVPAPEAITIAESPMAEVIRNVVAWLLSSENRGLEVECLALASGVCHDGLAPNQIARRYGLSRAAVSRRCIRIEDNFGLPPSAVMRSERAREIARRARRKTIERN